MTPQLTVLSLGWGVQSWTLAAMVALGDLPPIDAAIHADTTWEHQATYAFAAAMTPWLAAHGIPVVTVCDHDQAAAVTTGKTDIPAFTAGADGFDVINGQLRRQCTSRWKIQPQRDWILAELMRRGLARWRMVKIPTAAAKIRVRWPNTGVTVEKWFGISRDEWHRAKHSDVRYEVHRYPLLENGMSRVDCIAWLRAHDLPVPPKSSCVYCPFQSPRAWQQMKRDGGPDWAIALDVDRQIRNVRPPYPLFVHSARRPLAEAVQIPEDFGLEQRDLFDRPEDDAAVTCDSGHCFL